MILKEKEKTVIQDLQTQEKSCVEKYGRYAEQAKDSDLRICSRLYRRKSRSTMIHLPRCLTDRFHSVTAMTAMEKIMSQSRHTR